MAVLAVIFGIRTVLGLRQVRRDASSDFDYKRTNGMVPDTMDQDSYEKIYRRVYGPRGSAYVASVMLAILIITPLAMAAFGFGLNFIYNLSGQDRVIEPGYLVWQFFIFFGIIAVWVGIAYVAARRYHQNAPGSLQFEIDQHIYGGSDFGERF